MAYSQKSPYKLLWFFQSVQCFITSSPSSPSAR